MKINSLVLVSALLLAGLLIATAAPVSVTSQRPPPFTNQPISTITLNLSAPVVGNDARAAATYTLLNAGADRVPGTADDRLQPVAPAYADGSNQIQLLVIGTNTLDLRSWRELDYENGNSGNWIVETNGQSVFQTVNANLPTFFISDADFFDRQFIGRMRVENDTDNDFIGLVFAFHTNAINGKPDSYYYLSWKKENQVVVGSTNNGEAGFKLLKITDSSSLNTNDIRNLIWDGENGTNIQVLARLDGVNSLGWVLNTSYDFTVFYQTNGQIAVSIRDATVGVIRWQTTVTDSAPLGPGRIGFLNHSQASVRYSGLAQSDTLFEGVYQLTARSGTPGLRGLDGVAIDGNGDGVAGDNYVSRFLIDVTAPRVNSAAFGPGSIDVGYFDLGGMDPATVTNVLNYTLLASGGDGSFGEGNEVNGSGRIRSISFATNTAVATLVLAPPLEDEVYQLTINGAAVHDLAGNSAAFQTNFIIDTTGPVITLMTPAGVVASVIDHLDITFDSAIAPSTFTAIDVALSGPVGAIAVSGVQSLASNLFRINFPAQGVSGTYTVSIGPNITDLAGNPMNQDGDSSNGEVPQDAFAGQFIIRLPDLMVSHIAAPAIALAGQPIEVTWTVTNRGTDTAIGPWTDALFLSSDAAAGNDLSLASFMFSNSIPASQSLVRTAIVIVPFALTGDWFLVVSADAANQVPEGFNENNNTTVDGQPVRILSPDLVVESLTVSANAQFGQTINVVWSVRNTGTAPAIANWSDRLYLGTNAGPGATILLTQSAAEFVPLAAGASYTRTQAVTLPLSATLAPGNYFITAAADFSNAQPESNETNNSTSAAIALTLPPLPDLAIERISAPAFALSGQPVQLVWTVTNRGGLQATGVWSEIVSLSGDANLGGDLPLATFRFTNTLEAGGVLIRAQTLSLPLASPTGNVRFVVETDSEHELFEDNETNNAALAPAPTQVPAQLTLQLPLSQMLEGAPPVQAAIWRNGNASQPLVVTLSNSHPTELQLPAGVTLGAGQAAAVFTVRALRDNVVDGPQLVTLTANAPGFATSSAQVTVLDVDVPRLTLTLETNVVVEGLAISGTVTREVVTTNALTVTLSSSSSAHLLPPPNVVIPADRASAAFLLLAQENTLIEPPRSCSINADASGFSSATASVTVLDNDLPAVQLTLTPTNVSEGAGPQASVGTVTRSPVTSRALVLKLESLNTNAALVPATVTIPGNAAFASFPIAAVDDDVVDGDATADIVAIITASGSGDALVAGASATLTVADDDGPTLKVRVAKKLVAEGLSPATSAMVTRNTGTNAALMVNLASSDTSEATVPANVIIPAGQTAATFDIASLNDNVTDGNQLVTITANASGFASGNDTLTVSDTDLPDLMVANITAPATADTEALINIGYRVVNQGPAPAASNWLTRIFLSPDPLIGDDILLSQYTFRGTIPSGLFFEQTLSARLPPSAGDYWVVVQTDSANEVAETLEGNNTTISAAPIHVQASYAATVQTDVITAPAGTPLRLAGRAFRNADDQPAPFVLVNIHLSVRGTRRIISALTDAQGNFSATFTPLPSEAGFYQIGAAHPGDATAPVQDSFTLLGMRANPPPPAIKIVEQSTVTGRVQLENLSDLPLTGLSASVIDKPGNLRVSATVGNGGALPGSGTVPLDYSITADDASIPQGTVRLRVTSAEGASLEVPLAITVEALRARLTASPSALVAGMKRGGQALVEFEVANLGGLPSGPISVLVPEVPWLHVASVNPLPSLAPGESNRVTLQLTPAADLALGEYKGGLSLNGSQVTLNVPFNFRALSEAKGELQISAVDEYTYYAEGAPRVTNATVTVKDAVTGQVVTNGFTDGAGEFFAGQLMEGYYDLELNADKHASFRSTVLLAAGQTNEEVAFLSRQTVQYFWNVVPTEIEDQTKIVIETVFETVVPVPVITLEPSSIDLDTLRRPVDQVLLTIRNHGLIAADAAKLHFGAHPLYKITPLIEDIGVIPALSSITIPVTVEQIEPPAGAGRPEGAAAAPRVPCSITAGLEWRLICGPGFRYYWVPLPVFHVQGDCGAGGGGGIPPSGPCVDCGGGGWIFHPPTIVPPPTCQGCDEHDFAKTCFSVDFGNYIRPLANGLLATLKRLPIVRGSGSADIKAEAQVCSCCLDGGISLEGKASGEITVQLKTEVLLAGTTIDVETDWPQANLSADIKISLGSLRFENALGVALGGEAEVQCRLSGVKAKAFLRAFDEPKLVADVGITVDLKKNGVAIQKYEDRAFAELSTKIYAELFADTMTGVGGQACVDPLKFKMGITVTDPVTGLRYEAAIEKELTEKVCIGAESGPEWSQPQPVDEALLRALAAAARAPQANASESLASAANNGEAGVCAQVRLRLDQEAVLTRNAFNATLDLINRDAVAPLEDIAVSVSVSDESGRSALERFGIREPVLSGISAVDGGGVLGADSTGKASWILIPTRDAAPASETVYQVGGLLSYRQGGTRVTVPLVPVPITVRPDPLLVVKYFHQRDVFSDDPFTAEIEPAIPFSLAVMVQNRGQGEATNFRITSAQPQIIENEKGLLIDFRIIATEVAGQNLAPSLTVEFGNIDPGQTRIGRWLLTSTLQGLFVNYQASFEHLDPLGNPRLSLIDEVTIHEMIHLVQAPGAFEDGQPDFLVNDIPDPPLDLPDTLYLSDGGTNAVAAVTNTTITGTLSPGNLSVQLAATTPGGWVYWRAADPAQGRFKLIRVQRSDGATIAFGTNVWTTDRTFVGMGRRPVRENVLHLLDYNSTGTYTLFYEIPAPTDQRAPVSAVAALPLSSAAQIPVQWTGQDEAGGSGLLFFDVFVSANGGPFVPWLQETRLNGSVYDGMQGSTYAFYSVATDVAGNREAAPITPDAQTRVGIANTPPRLSPVSDRVINEGDLLLVNLAALDSDEPANTLAFSLGAGAPAGAVLDSATGLLSWQTGEAHGPSTNIFTVTVADNGAPTLSDTTHFMVIVQDVNALPTLVPIPDQAVGVGDTLLYTNRASDFDIPAQQLTFSLEAGGPEGVLINPATGVLRWRPTAAFATSTNLITVRVTDSGLPRLSDSKSFHIIVLDYLALGLGSAILRTGESGSVPINIFSSAGLVELSFALDVAANHLADLGVAPIGAHLGSASLQPLTATRSLVHLRASDGQALLGTEQIAQLTFTAISNRPSAFVPLLLSDILATKTDGALVPRVLGQEGRVVLIGNEPLLEALVSADRGRALVLYGKVGTNYLLESGFSLAEPIDWQPKWRGPLTNLFQFFGLQINSNPAIFYRAQER